MKLSLGIAITKALEKESDLQNKAEIITEMREQYDTLAQERNNDQAFMADLNEKVVELQRELERVYGLVEEKDIEMREALEQQQVKFDKQRVLDQQAQILSRGYQEETGLSPHLDTLEHELEGQMEEEYEEERKKQEKIQKL